MFGAGVLLLCVQDGCATFASKVMSKCNEQGLPTGANSCQPVFEAFSIPASINCDILLKAG